MSNLTPSDIKEFQEMWKRRFGEDLDDREARAEAEALVRLLGETYRPVTQSQVDELKTDLSGT